MIASLVIVRPKSRSGFWFWPATVLLLSLAITSRSEFSYQPYSLNVLLTAARLAVPLWIALRFGLLAGVAAVFSWALLDEVRGITSLQIPYLRTEAVLYLVLWLTLLAAETFIAKPWRASQGRMGQRPTVPDAVADSTDV